MKEDGTVKKVHSLIDKVYQVKNLRMAWDMVKANKGSGGIDNVRITDFDKVADEELVKLHNELKMIPTSLCLLSESISPNVISRMRKGP